MRASPGGLGSLAQPQRRGTPSMGFPRQEYWSVCITISFSGNLPDPGIEPRSPALQADALPSEPPGKPNIILYSTVLKKLLFSSKSCPTFCEPMDCSTPGFTVLHCLLKFAQTPGPRVPISAHPRQHLLFYLLFLAFSIVSIQMGFG